MDSKIKPPATPRLKALAVEIRPRPDANPALSNNPLGTAVAADIAAVTELARVNDAYANKGGVAAALEVVGTLGPVSELTAQFAVQLLAKDHPEILVLLNMTNGTVGVPTVETVAKGFRGAIGEARKLAVFAEQLGKVADPFAGAAAADRVGLAFGLAPFALLVEQLPELPRVLDVATRGLHEAMLKGTPEEATEALQWLARMQARLPNAPIEIRPPKNLSPERRELLENSAIAALEKARGNGPIAYAVPLMQARAVGLTLEQIEQRAPGITDALTSRTLMLLNRNRGSDAQGTSVLTIHQMMTAFPGLKTPEIAAALRLSATHVLVAGAPTQAVRLALEPLVEGARTAIDLLRRGDYETYDWMIGKRPDWSTDRAAASAALGAYLDETRTALGAGVVPSDVVDNIRFGLSGAGDAFPEHAAKIKDLEELLEKRQP